MAKLHKLCSTNAAEGVSAVQPPQEPFAWLVLRNHAMACAGETAETSSAAFVFRNQYCKPHNSF